MVGGKSSFGAGIQRRRCSYDKKKIQKREEKKEDKRGALTKEDQKEGKRASDQEIEKPHIPEDTPPMLASFHAVFA